MDANIDSSRKPTIVELVVADVATRFEALVNQDEETRIQLVGKLPNELILKMLKSKNSRIVKHDLMIKEIKRRSQVQVPPLDEWKSLDVEAKAALISTLDPQKRILLSYQMSMRDEFDLIHRIWSERYEVNAAVSNAREFTPFIQEFIQARPLVRLVMLLVQDRETQLYLLENMPAQAKAEMILLRFQNTLNSCVTRELKRRKRQNEQDREADLNLKRSKGEDRRTTPRIPTIEELVNSTPAQRFDLLEPLDDEIQHRLIEALPDQAAAEMAQLATERREQRRRNEEAINKLANLLLRDMLSVKPRVRYLMWKTLENEQMKQWLLDQMPMRAIAEMWSAGRDLE